MRPRPHRFAARALVAVVALLAASIVSACGTETSPPAPKATAAVPYTVVRDSTIDAAAPIPAPTGATVLTMSGKVTGASPVAFDMATLEKLRLVEYSVLDKQAEGKRVTFRGVLLADLLAAIGAKDATTLHTLALNDYAVDIPVSDTRTYPVLLATAVDGERMSVERYGPLRVVYPTDGVKLDPAVYDPRWIWQLDKIEVR